MSAVLALPTRRVEEWKYSDLSQALGEAGFGADQAKAVVGPLPVGVEAFDLDEANRPAWVKAQYGKLQQNSVSAVSLALACHPCVPSLSPHIPMIGGVYWKVH